LSIKDLEKCPFCKKPMFLGSLWIRSCTNKKCGSQMFQSLSSSKKEVTYKFAFKQNCNIVKIYVNEKDLDLNFTKIFVNDPMSPHYYGLWKNGDKNPLIYLSGEESIVPDFKDLKSLQKKIDMLLTFY